MMNNVSFIISWKDSPIILLSFAKILFLKNSHNFNFLLENFFAHFSSCVSNHYLKTMAHKGLMDVSHGPPSFENIFEKGYLMINTLQKNSSEAAFLKRGHRT